MPACTLPPTPHRRLAVHVAARQLVHSLFPRTHRPVCTRSRWARMLRGPIRAPNPRRPAVPIAGERGRGRSRQRRGTRHQSRQRLRHLGQRGPFSAAVGHPLAQLPGTCPPPPEPTLRPGQTHAAWPWRHAAMAVRLIGSAAAPYASQVAARAGLCANREHAVRRV